MAEYYYEDDFNENEDDFNENENEEDELTKYTRIEYKIDDIMENIYNDVIVPYLDTICQREILDNLDEYTMGKFINFYKFNSTYYKYVLNKIDKNIK